jgi:chemotaxis protein MotB
MRQRRTKPIEENTNHDRWLVSYADLMTLLLAFFVVLFASSYRDNQTLKRLSQAIHIGFQQLGAFSGGENNRGVAYPNLPPDPSTYTPQVHHPPSEPAPAATAAAYDLAQLQQQIQAALGKEMQDHEVETRVTPEGFVISLKELGFFSSGQAGLVTPAAGKIERIAKILGQHGLELRIEGHSDDQPIHSAQFDSNWELSTARAMAVMKFLVEKDGFDPKKISVAGYGEYRPIADNSTVTGRRANRRVDLVVVSKLTPQPVAH